jgi:dTDP-4-dehydrorhamnose 3,5-epimerase
MQIHVEKTPLEGVLLLSHEIAQDDRGFFMEVFRADEYEKIGLPTQFLQENHSRSKKGVVRGLHFQWDKPMAKLMRVTYGTAMLVAVDIRPGSLTLGRWYGVEASADNKKQLWAPPGCARGFCALTDFAEVQYKCTAIYNPRGEGSVLWNDPAVGIDWPVSEPSLSEKDRDARPLAEWLKRPEAEIFRYA